MVAADPVYGAIVEPHCVQLPEGIPPGIPAMDHSTARWGEIIPPQAWPWAAKGHIRKIGIKKRVSARCFILAPCCSRERRRGAVLFTSLKIWRRLRLFSM